MSFFGDIQTEVITRLKTDTAINAIGVLAEDKGNFESEISKRLKSLGICILVAVSRARMDSPDLPTPYFDDIEVLVEISENVLLNRQGETYETAGSMVDAVMLKLHHYLSSASNLVYTLDNDAVQMIDPPSGATVAYHVRFKTQGGITPPAS